MDNVLSVLYDQYISFYYSNNYYHLIYSNPSKFYKVLKTKQNFSSFSQEIQSKIFNQTCNMIKSINIDSILLGLNILKEIINYIPSEDFSNSFTYNKTLTENNNGIFAYVLEEKKEIKVQTLKLISTHIDIIKTEKYFDFIIELINDEEDEVRFATIDCLFILINRIQSFPFGMCDILLFALREKQTSLRRKIILLISSMKFNLDKVQFKKVVNIFKENMTIFARDKSYIFEGIKKFSKINCYCLSEEYFIDCFKIESNFLIVEINWEDKYYIINFITFMEFIIWKKFELNMSIPKFFVKHFYYFEEKYPKVFNENIAGFFLNKKLNDGNNKEDIIINEVSNEERPLSEWSKKDIEQYVISNENTGRITIDQLYTIIFKYIEWNKWEEVMSDLLIRQFTKLNLLLVIENDNSALIEKNGHIIQLIQNKNYQFLINEGERLKEDISMLLNEDIKKKQLLQIEIIHPESYQTYLNPNRRDLIFPFSLPIHIKISNISNPNYTLTNNNQAINIFIMKRLKVVLLNEDDHIEKDVKLLPSSDATISIYQSFISVKKNELLFLKKSNNVDRNTNLKLKLRCGILNSDHTFNYLIEDTLFTIQSK